ncbi:MAG TPA: AI-2E family transporter [Alphaproteobacteria bacterium]
MRFDNLDRSTIYRTLVIVVSVTAILWGCLIILQPFIPAFLLAIIFTLSTWPAFAWLKDRLEGKRTLAALVMTLLLATCFLVPLIFMGTSLADNFSRLYAGVIAPLLSGPVEMPVWLNDLPWIGTHFEAIWNDYIVANLQDTEGLRAWLAPKLIAVGAAIGRGVLDVSLGILFAFFFFRHGVTAASRVSALITKFVGPKGQHLLDISKRTVIGVVYGVLGTAIAQGALAGLGFWIAGVPGAPFLGLLTSLLSFVPMGPPLIWVPATMWLFSQGYTGSGIFLTLYGLFGISMVDNIIRPYFISLGSSLPLLLVILGVFGGLLAFGFIGLFIGPTLLAVAYSLVFEWSRSDPVIEEAVENA